MSLQHRIQEKKRELESLQQVQDLSQNLCSQLEQLEARLDTLADGTELSLANYADADYENTDNPPLPETLVRLRIAEDEVSDLADGKDVADDDE